MDKKRFQECNWYEKLWRYRFYLALPFQWLYHATITPIVVNNDEGGDPLVMNGRGLWKLLIGLAQIKMDWYYTMDEVMAESEKWKENHPWCKCEEPTEDYRMTEWDEPYCVCKKCMNEIENPSKWNNNEN
jgi:hypothetical protein